MPEQEEKIIEQVLTANAFSSDSWSETAPVIEEKKEEVTPIIEEKKEEIIEEKNPEIIEEVKIEPVVDEDAWVKEQFGVDNKDALKKQLEELQKKAAAGNYTQEQWDTAYDVLHKKKTIEKVISGDVTSANAEKIIKLSLRNRYADLDDSEVEDEFNEHYGVPAKPAQKADQLDDDYEDEVADWNKKVEQVQKKMIREAKIAKPDLVKWQSELVLPEIKVEQVNNAPTQEDLAKAQKIRETYLQQLEVGVREFGGFTAVVKDKDVETKISYAPTAEEKTAYKERLSDFNLGKYFDARWAPEPDKFNTKQMQEDIYLIENKEKILNKVASDAYARALEDRLKTEKNTNINGIATPPKETVISQPEVQQDAAKFFFSN